MANIVAQLVIALTDDGAVGVTGPVDQKLLALGLLECAKEAILKKCAEQERRIVSPPPGFHVVKPS